MMEKVRVVTGAGWSRITHPRQRTVAWLAMGGGVVIIFGAGLAWFSLFAGLQPYRGVDLLNGRLLMVGGLLSILAGAWFFQHGRFWLRFGIGLLGFVLLALASWSLLQLLVIYRRLSADPFMVATLGPGLFLVLAGAVLIFATLFLAD